MTLNEALIAANGKWFRPVTWRGSGAAYCINDDYLCIVPAPHGVTPSSIRNSDIIQDWEVVYPGDVLSESGYRRRRDER